MGMLHRLSLIVLTAAALAGCAQKAQTVRLAPAPELTGAEAIGGQRRVALEVLDRREQPALGELLNHNKPAAPITSEQPLEYVLQLAAADAISAWGFRPAIWDDDAERRLVIEVLTLHHTVDASLPHDTETVVELGLRAFQGGRTMEAKASARSSDRLVALSPSAEESAEAIDRTVAKAMERLFDRRLAAFLAGE